MKIRAAIFRAPHEPFAVEEVDLQPPQKGEVLVRMKAVGVCHSDYHLATGATQHPAPAVIGHEGAGVVEGLGEDVASVDEGDAVALSWAPNCGDCFYCGKGRPSLCEAYVEPIWAGTMLDGTTRLSQNGQRIYHYSALACFADYAVVPEQCCVRMPATLPFESAALIGCAVTTGVGAVFNTAQVEPGSSVVVFGCGGVGLSVVMGARAAGAEPIIAVDPHMDRLAAARELGAIGVLPKDVMPVIHNLTEWRGADYVFEAVGDPRVQEQCLEAARPGGVVVLSGIAPMGSATNFPGAILTRQEKTVMGSYYGTANPGRDFPRYAKMALEGTLPLERLISKHYRLEEINEAYADLLSGTGRRGVIVF